MWRFVSKCSATKGAWVNVVKWYVFGGGTFSATRMPDVPLFSLAAQFHLDTMATAFAIAVSSVVVLRPFARLAGWVDRPSPRKSHEGEIPLVGGWAILLALIAVQFAGPPELMAPGGYWVGALILFCVAVVDDRFPIRARYRLVAQLVAATAGIALGGQMLPDLGDLFGTGGLTAWWIVLPVSILGTVALINAINFMDGADGLCGGLAFIALFWYLVAVAMASSVAGRILADPTVDARSIIPMAAALMGGLAGFLVFNLRTPWRRSASVFLGDSGSMVVGFTLAWVALHLTSAFGTASVSPIVFLWIVAVPLADALSCFVRRTLAGDTPMTADLKHLHHLLPRLGLTTSRSVLLIHVSSFLCGLVGVAGWWLDIPDKQMFTAFVASLLAFTVGTNLAWRRIEKRNTLLHMA